MRPTLLHSDDIARYVDDGHWSRETHAARLTTHAEAHPDRAACLDQDGSLTWSALNAASDDLAAGLIGLGLTRDSRALVQMPSSCREMILRLALKKAGIIGVFVPMQWQVRELAYVRQRIEPDLIVFQSDTASAGTSDWLTEVDVAHRLDLAQTAQAGWVGWTTLAKTRTDADTQEMIASRAFQFDEVSLITASSGTSGLAKLCEWPEAAQVCIGRLIGERLRITEDDTIGIFSPMSGAAGVLVWLVSATVPVTIAFPPGYRASDLLNFAADKAVTVATTVPVILARLAQEPLETCDTTTLRALRVGTAATDIGWARQFEEGADCRVVVAAGSMECPGFAHGHVDEPPDIRLSGAIGLPLPGCRARIDNDDGAPLSAGHVGELKVSAPYAASGYWRDAQETGRAWTDGWYATGDMGSLDPSGRLTLLGRLKETINRSGLKILPAEVEHEIAKHPHVFESAVVAAPDREYGEVAWAFVQPRSGHQIAPDALAGTLRAAGLAHYKIPTRFIIVDALPRVSASKVDKKVLREQVTKEMTLKGDI